MKPPVIKVHISTCPMRSLVNIKFFTANVGSIIHYLKVAIEWEEDSYMPEKNTTKPLTILRYYTYIFNDITHTSVDDE